MFDGTYLIIGLGLGIPKSYLYWCDNYPVDMNNVLILGNGCVAL